MSDNANAVPTDAWLVRLPPIGAIVISLYIHAVVAPRLSRTLDWRVICPLGKTNSAVELSCPWEFEDVRCDVLMFDEQDRGGEGRGEG